jgi:hypothetical protein
MSDLLVGEIESDQAEAAQDVGRTMAADRRAVATRL